MLKDLLKEVISLVAGKQAEDIVDLLDEQKYINEFVIAKKLNLTINQVRNILYKISDYGLVSSIRKKDKKKGWYTYFWKIEVLKSLEFLKENLIKKIDNVNHQIKSREIKRFYVCPRCHMELTEEHALLNNFTCPECGSILELKDNNKMIKDLRKSKEKFERDMAIVDSEIVKERGKEEKKRVRGIKKEEKIKAVERAKAAKKRKLAKKKEKAQQQKASKPQKQKSHPKAKKKAKQHSKKKRR